MIEPEIRRLAVFKKFVSDYAIDTTISIFESAAFRRRREPEWIRESIQ